VSARYVTDTHALIWHLQGQTKLSSKVSSIFSRADNGQAIIIIPTIVLVEMIYLAEKKRIAANLVNLVLQLLQSGSQNYQLAPLDLLTVNSIALIPRTLVPDMPDRIIAATGHMLNLPLLTRDPAIIKVPQLQTIW